MRPTKVCLAVLLTASLLTASGAAAQTATPKLLEIELSAGTQKVRTCAPTVVIWKVTWKGASLLEGVLEITLEDGDGQTLALRTQELVLTAGEQRIRTVIPSRGQAGRWTQGEMQVSFTSENRTFDLGRHLLPHVPRSWNFGIGWCDDGIPSRDDQALVHQLDLWSHDPDSIPNDVGFLLSRMTPDDLTADPLQFCGFDLFVLTPGGLTGVRNRTLDALRKWVRAGGSLLVRIDDDIPAERIAFLNDLLNDAPQAFVADSTSHVRSGPWLATDGFLLKQCDLGRVAFVGPGIFQANREDISISAARRQRRIVGYLWRMCLRNEEPFIASGEIRSRALPSGLPSRRIRYSGYDENMMPWHGVPAPLLFESDEAFDTITSVLMPEEVQVVPIGLTGMVLVGFLAWIGPVEYFMLGALGLRRFTWITFPTATLLTAGGLIWLTNSFLATSDSRRQLIIRDMNGSGQVLRENRIQLTFAATRKNLSSTFTRTLFSPLRESRPIWLGRNNALAFNPQGQPAGPTRYEGLLPSRYQVHREIRQWTPQLTRFMAISPDEETDGHQFGFAWDQLESLDNDRDKLVRRIQESFGSKASVIIYGPSNQVQVIGNRTLRYDPYLSRTLARFYPNRSSGSIIRAKEIADFLCQQPNTDWQQTLLFQISPHGGDSLADLCLHDATDPHRRLLVVVVPRGDDIHVYRRQYRSLRNRAKEWKDSL